VRREGRITTAQQRALNELEPRFGVDTTRPLSALELFGREMPLELEIGCGNGEALLQMAAMRPEHGFIGIEVYRPGLGKLLLGIETGQLENVRVSSMDAVELVKTHVQPGSLRRIMVFFPDPWPKKRHQKRRLLNREFITLLAHRLEPGGELHMATDWEDYAHWIVDASQGVSGLEPVQGGNFFVPRPEHRPVTKYEQRGQRLGHQVFDIVLRRVD